MQNDFGQSRALSIYLLDSGHDRSQLGHHRGLGFIRTIALVEHLTISSLCGLPMPWWDCTTAPTLTKPSEASESRGNCLRTLVPQRSGTSTLQRKRGYLNRSLQQEPDQKNEK
ncbi:hypothetical protein PM082_008222 [Marasmius tenuissimus]|nr:hypothetical protein PM082_008222 [Marasmius tenuissimus]